LKKNIQHLLDGWGRASPLVHIRFDDDVVYPDFYRAHVQAHAAAHHGASVSLRWVTRPDGRPFAELPLPEFLRADPRRVVPVAASELFASVVPGCASWLGEMSNTVLSREGARRYRNSSMDGLSYHGLSDIGSLLDVSRVAPSAVIRDHLGVFRTHPLQTTKPRGLRSTLQLSRLGAAGARSVARRLGGRAPDGPRPLRNRPSRRCARCARPWTCCSTATAIPACCCRYTSRSERPCSNPTRTRAPSRRRGARRPTPL
jgi:hypothetical protein